MNIINHNIGKQKGFTISFGLIQITWIRLNNKFKFNFQIIKGE